MLLKPNPSSGVPIYLQLMEQIKHAIETGALRAGEQLPGIRKLAEELVINPNTIAKVYRELEHEGVIELRQGAGAFVAERKGAVVRPQILRALPLIRNLITKLSALNLSEEEMRRLFAEGKAGHAGFMESLSLIGHAMGWNFTETYELFEPVIAPYDIKTKFFDVKKGQCCGIHQQVVGKVGDVQRVHMDLRMYLDARDPHDAIKITGEPPLEVRINGGVAGDHATVASLVNAVPRVLKRRRACC